MKKSFGFTLIEILVSAVVIVMLTGGGLAAYLDFNNRQILDTATDELRNNLRQARGWAMAGRKMAGCNGSLIGYQFRFLSGNQYQIQLNCTSSGNTTIRTFSYDDKVTINSGQSSFIFYALTGETRIPAFTIVLSLGSRSRTLTVNTNGEIN